METDKREGIVRIEVECKFEFSDHDVERIATLAEPMGVKEFTDRYFDRIPDFALTTRDMWLRQRAGRWELKTSVLSVSEQQRERRARTASGVTPSNVMATQYRECEDPREIHDILASLGLIASSGSKPEDRDQSPDQESEARELSAALDAGGIVEFCALTTTRTSFRFRDALRIDLDVVTPGGYRVGELEMMVRDDAEEISNARERIASLASELGLTIRPSMRGKVLQLIFLERPEHWRLLETSGLLDAKDVRV